MKPYYLISFIAIVPLSAQTRLFTFGVQGGVPGELPLVQSENRTPFVIGPTVNIRILSRLSLETGILYHRMGQHMGSGTVLYPENSITLVSSTDRAHALELPFLAKYSILGGRRTWRPFVIAGPAIRRASLDSRYSSSVLSTTPLPSQISPTRFNSKTTKWNADPMVGAGVDFKSGPVHLEPEVRYSYWGAGKNLPVRKNQVNFLLGFRF